MSSMAKETVSKQTVEDRFGGSFTVEICKGDDYDATLLEVYVSGELALLYYKHFCDKPRVSSFTSDLRHLELATTELRLYLKGEAGV